MLLDRLCELLPPPLHPIETGIGGRWTEVRQQIGIRPAEDYIRFLETYGTGSTDNFLWVLNPFARNANLNWIKQVPLLLSGMRILKADHAASFQFPLYFEHGGFLPWGVSDNSDIFGWATTGETGNWTTIVVPRHSAIELHSCSMSEYLCGLLTGTIESQVSLESNKFSPID